MTTAEQSSKRALGWREPILQHFTQEIATTTRITIVADPDNLLNEQEILHELSERGFELMAFDDHVAFRFAYESRYRQLWDRGENTNLVVVLRSANSNLESLPYDLLERAKYQSRCLSFSVAELFPNLSSGVIEDIDRDFFDALFEAQAQIDSGRIGVNATKDFVLQHVYKIVPGLISKPSDLLQVLLRRHYRGLSCSPVLDDRFIELLGQDDRWDDWPLVTIVSGRPDFLGFLNERWPYFVQRAVKSDANEASEATTEYGLTYPGPLELPFGHDDVKVYIDNLFQEGQLTPVDGFAETEMPEAWMRVGVAGGDGDRRVRFERLIARLRNELPDDECSHRDWITYARTWAEWSALRWDIGDAKTGVPSSQCDALHEDIEERFASWMHRNYASLHNLSPFLRPAMVHHIPQHLAQTAANALTKHALIVVDGLAIDQWVVLRDALIDQLGDKIKIEEDGSFAWVPTLTSVSRQAIFAGAEPMFFAESIAHTSKESAHWIRFWENHGAKRAEIGYVREGKNQSDDAFLRDVLEESERPKMRLLGVVVGKVDQSMHGAKTGSGGLHAVVRDWASGGAMAKLVDTLLSDGFEIIITADHGNVHAQGIGKPNVGVTADERGERAHVFREELTRANTAEEFPGTIQWPQIGLPDDWRVLLAPGRGAFVPVGQQIIGHGGIAMEEVIVPFVKIHRAAS